MVWIYAVPSKTLMAQPISRLLCLQPKVKSQILFLDLNSVQTITLPSLLAPRFWFARVRAVLRRAQGDVPLPNKKVNVRNFSIDPERHEVQDGQGLVSLTATEFRILHFLASRPGCVYTRNQIVEAVHGDDYPVTDRSIDVQIVGLRRKLGDSGDFIETVRGVGYRVSDT